MIWSMKARARALARGGQRVAKHSLIACLAAITVTAPALASRFREQLTLDAMVTRSDAIIVCTVRAIDERASLDPAQPLTSVTCALDEVLRGQVPAGRKAGELDLVFRGGITTEGLRVRFSSVPQLTTGERYMLFLRSDYYVSPIVPAPQALIREVAKGGVALAVDENGRAIVASQNFGLVVAGKVARALDEVGGAPGSPPSGGNSLAGDDSLPAQAQPAASTFASVRELVRARARAAAAPAVALATAPLSLPSAPVVQSPNPAAAENDPAVSPAGETKGAGEQ